MNIINENCKIKSLKKWKRKKLHFEPDRDRIYKKDKERK